MIEIVTVAVLSPCERDSVLAGLRLLQQFNDGLVSTRVAGADDDIACIRDDSGEPLTNTQIDALCVELNS